jgi:hypothetical protein
LTRFKRFWKAPKQALPGIETPNPLTSRLNRYLTISPRSPDAPQNTQPEDAGELGRKQRDMYSQAEDEFTGDRPEVVKAWIKRKRHETGFFDNEEYRKATRNAVLASFITVLVTHTGLYPTKIPALGVEFPEFEKSSFLLFLIMLCWYLTLSMNMMVRDYIIEDALLEIEDKIDNVYKQYENRWTRYVDAHYVEKGAFNRKLPNWLTIYATLSAVISLTRSLFHI